MPGLRVGKAWQRLSLASFCANGTKSLQVQPKNDDLGVFLFDSLNLSLGSSAKEDPDN
jgi:hypothetical protein